MKIVKIYKITILPAILLAVCSISRQVQAETSVYVFSPGQSTVVKTGGSSNIPVFSEMLEGIFGVEKLKESNAFSSVTSGLAIRAFERS